MYIYLIADLLLNSDFMKCYRSMQKCISYIMSENNYFEYIGGHKNLSDIYNDSFGIVQLLDNHIHRYDERLNIVFVLNSIINYLKCNMDIIFVYVRNKEKFKSIESKNLSIQILNIDNDLVFSFGLEKYGIVTMYDIYPNIIKLIENNFNSLICQKLEIA